MEEESSSDSEGISATAAASTNLINNIKKQDAVARGYLARLAMYAYNAVKKDKNSSLLSHNQKQAQKYWRYEFTFDPDNSKNEQLFKEAFADSSQGAKALEALKAAHPFGVQIWVNPSDGKKEPLLEHNFTLSGKSVLSGAQMMLHDMQVKQNEIKTQGNDLVEKKYKSVSEKIKKEYEKYIAQIDLFYEEKLPQSDKNLLADEMDNLFTKTSFFETRPVNPSQFEKAQELLQAFQSRVIYHLTSFEIPTSAHSKKDYARNYKLLGQYEQTQKTYHKSNALQNNESDSGDDDDGLRKIPEPLNNVNSVDFEGNEFNRDIFTLDLDETKNLDETNQKPIRFRYHKRHYSETQKQIELKLIEDGESKNIEKKNVSSVFVNIPETKPTETAHSPGFGLANYAVVEEGNYDSTSATATVDFYNTRHGSLAPNELYSGKIKKLDRHEAVYRAYLNMEQNIQQLRAKVIENILQTNNQKLKFSDQEIIDFSAALSSEMSKKFTDFNKNSIFATVRRITSKLDVQKLVNEEDNIIGLIVESFDKIINIKNFYNHVITPTGVGSGSEDQRFHYRDTRIAQYATRQGEGGYIYMSNGVNSLRYDTRTFDNWHQKLKGNNCAALIELYKALPEVLSVKKINAPVDGSLDDKEDLPSYGPANKSIYADYDEKLEIVKKASRAYIKAVEKDYINKKLRLDYLEKRNQEILNLRDSAITGEIEELKQCLKDVKPELDGLKKAFKTAEKELHEEAKILNKKIYKHLLAQTGAIDSLNIEGKRDQYLVWKAFEIAQKLFNEEERGMKKWKLDKNNGVMQALLQFSAQKADVFGSYGCKSANDRALLISLLISQLSKIDNKQVLDKDYMNSLLKNAQRAYAWHISHAQTALDRSGAPKTGSDILQYADDILKKYKIYGAIAAHKRLKKPKKFKKYLSSGILFYHEKEQLSKMKSSEWQLGRFERFKQVKESLATLLDNVSEDVQTKENALQNAHAALEHLGKSFTVRHSVDKKVQHQLKQMEIGIDAQLYAAIKPADKNILQDIKTSMTEFVKDKTGKPFSEIQALLAKPDIFPLEFYIRVRHIFEDYRDSKDIISYTFFMNKELKMLSQMFVKTNLMAKDYAGKFALNAGGLGKFLNSQILPEAKHKQTIYADPYSEGEESDSHSSEKSSDCVSFTG